MEGLEISEILLSELERTLRIDTEFYTKENLLIESFIKRTKHSKLTELVKVSDGNHMAISEKFIDIGVPYYRGQDMQTFFIENASPICIDEKTFDEPVMRRSHLKKGDVLLSIVGTIGKLGLVYSDTKATCSCKLAILRPSNISAEFLAIFLASKYGNNQVKKFTRGAVQMGLILEDFDQLIIPILPLSFQTQIENLVKLAHSKLEESKTLYTSAENLLLSALGLNDFESKKVETNYNIKSFKDSFLSTSRLDAEYYQPKYEVLEKKIREYEGGFCKIGDYFTQNKSTFIRNKKGFNYIEIGDISVSDGSVGFNFVETENLPDNAKIKANKGDLLVSKVRPNRGAIAIIDFEQEDLVCSGAFTVLQETKNSPIKKETLQVFLRLENIKDLLLKYNCGTSYPVIKDEDILTLEIPLFSQEIQTQISFQVQESFRLRAESERLLALAKEAVEVAIEQGETEAEKLLLV